MNNYITVKDLLNFINGLKSKYDPESIDSRSILIMSSVQNGTVVLPGEYEEEAYGLCNVDYATLGIRV